MLKQAKTKVIAVLGLSSLSGLANAALPTAATDAITSIQTDGVAMIDALWPVLVAILGGFTVMKLFRKGVNKTT